MTKLLKKSKPKSLIHFPDVSFPKSSWDAQMSISSRELADLIGWRGCYSTLVSNTRGTPQPGTLDIVPQVSVHSGFRDLFPNQRSPRVFSVMSWCQKSPWAYSNTTYTVRQLCGITLLVPPFCLKAVLTRGYVGIYWGQSDQKKAMSFYASRGGKTEDCSFYSAVQNQDGAIRRTGRPVVVRMVQGRFVEAGYQSRHPDRCPRRTHHHRCRRRMLADMHSNWNHQHWSHPIFDDESRVSLYHFDHRSCEFHLFLSCNNTLAFQKHDEKLRHARNSCRGWLWTHQRIAHETSPDGPSCGACVQTCGGSGDGQESVIGLDVFSCY